MCRRHAACTACRTSTSLYAPEAPAGTLASTAKEETMTSPMHIRLHHLPRHPVSRALSLILLLSMPLQGCSHQRVIGPTSPPQDYSEANDLLAGRSVQLEMTTGSIFSGAQFVRVGPDSVRFMQAGTRAPISIPAERFLSATYHNRSKVKRAFVMA